MDKVTHNIPSSSQICRSGRSGLCLRWTGGGQTILTRPAVSSFVVTCVEKVPPYLEAFSSGFQSHFLPPVCGQCSDAPCHYLLPPSNPRQSHLNFNFCQPLLDERLQPQQPMEVKVAVSVMLAAIFERSRCSLHS